MESKEPQIILSITAAITTSMPEMRIQVGKHRYRKTSANYILSGQRKRLRLNELMPEFEKFNGNYVDTDSACIGFTTYCFPEQAEEAIGMLKEKVSQAFHCLSASVEKLKKSFDQEPKNIFEDYTNQEPIENFKL